MAFWVSAFVLYIVFRLWYDGTKKPLTADEVDHFCQVLTQRASEGIEQQDIDVYRRFMEEDDGKEFVMVNLVQFNPSPIVHPDTGKDIQAPVLLTEYFKPLMKMFLSRAGHPVFSGRVRGGYLDAWNTPENPGWHVAGLIRYRSRRDAMLASLANPAFQGIHKFKVAAIRQTFAIPVHKNGGLYASPRVTVALVLALAAALLQIGLD